MDTGGGRSVEIGKSGQFIPVLGGHFHWFFQTESIY
jgi:hypothetical protein